MFGDDKNETPKERIIYTSLVVVLGLSFFGFMKWIGIKGNEAFNDQEKMRKYAPGFVVPSKMMMEKRNPGWDKEWYEYDQWPARWHGPNADVSRELHAQLYETWFERNTGGQAILVTLFYLGVFCFTFWLSFLHKDGVE